MAVDLREVFRRGGRGLIDLLDYAVKSMQTDVVFVCLVDVYRLDPTVARALALGEVFCAPTAPLRLKGAEVVLPPRDGRLEGTLSPLRQALARQALATPTSEGEGQDEGDARPAIVVPPRLPKYLFDFVVTELEKSSDGILAKVSASYDSERSAEDNLPGSGMTPEQHLFVDQVWRKNARGRLISGGFRNVANVG